MVILVMIQFFMWFSWSLVGLGFDCTCAGNIVRKFKSFISHVERAEYSKIPFSKTFVTLLHFFSKATFPCIFLYMHPQRRDQQGANLRGCIGIVLWDRKFLSGFSGKQRKIFGCNLGSDKYKLLKIHIVNLILVGLTELGKIRGLVGLSNRYSRRVAVMVSCKTAQK